MSNLVRWCCALAAASLLAFAYAPTAFLSPARTPAAASVITVNSTADFAADDGQCTLREALNSAANDAPSGATSGECAAGSGDDTINVNVTGTINLSDMLSTTTNVSIVGPGSSLLTLRSTGSPHRVFFANVSTVNISGLTMTNGSFSPGGGSGGGLINGSGTMKLTDVVVTDNHTPDGTSGSTSSGSGGGIYNSGTLTLINCVVSGNSTGNAYAAGSGEGGRGGGIDSGNGSLTLVNTVVSGNHTGTGPGKGGDGGGIFVGGTGATLTGSTVSGNSTGAGASGQGSFGGHGGGIYNVATLTLTGSTVSGNSTGKGGAGGAMGGSGGNGGGIYSQSGTATLTGSSVSGNSTGDGDFTGSGNGGGGGGLGGGIHNRNATLTITDSVVSDNITGKDVFGNRAPGGGLVNYFGYLTVTGSGFYGNTGANGSAIGTSYGDGFLKMANSTISGNLSSVAIEVRESAAPTLTNCTITANPAGGVGVSSALPPVVGNTIIARNGPAGDGPDVTGSFKSQGHNLIGDGSGATGFNAPGDQVGTAAAPVDPRLGPLASNGGPTKTHALLAGSPALDAGDNPLAKDANDNALATDQRGAGFARRADSADADATQTVDIGAYESHPTVEDIADKTMFEDSTLSFNFNVGDAALGLTSVAASSSNASLVPNDPAHISVTGAGSQRTLSVTPAAGANTPANGTAVITVTAAASNGRTASDTFALTVFVDHAPTALDLSNTTVADNADNVTVGTLSTTHPDAGETFTYTLVPGVGDTDNAFFFINGSTLSGGRFDFETKPVYAARVRSTDSNGDFIERAFLITVTDGPDSTGAISFTASDFSVSESGGSATIRLARTGGSDNRVTARVDLYDVTTSAADYDFAPGALDASFNPGGEGASSHSSGLAQYVAALAYQVDGKAIVGGAFLFYNGLQRGRLARVESDGSLDTSFDSGVGANGPVNAIALQPDGKVIIAGAFTSYNNVGRNRIARLNDDGTLDTTFNTSGPNGDLYVLAMQPDGKILVGGTFNSFGGSSARRQIVRLNSDGSLDPDFNPVGTNGAGVDADAVQAIAPQPDGKILVGGGFIEFSGVTNTRVLRLNANGSVDNTFTPSIGISMAVRDIVLQPDGRPIVVGESIGNDTPYGKRGVVRLNADGTVDAAFDPGAGTNGGTVESAAFQPDGKLVIGGWFTSYNGANANRLARLNTNGSLDATFNPGAGANSPVRDVLVQPGGRVLVGGQQTSYNNTPSNGLTRVRGDLFVTWNPGETFNRTILLPIVNDSLAESNETLSLSLTTFGAPAGSPATSTLTINDNETAVSAVSGTGPYSGTATLAATLTSGGSPLPGKLITLTLGGTTGTAMTNASGVATFSGATLQDLPPGSYPNLVGASFAGDASYTGSSGTGTLTVNKADTTTTVTVSNATYDGNPHGGTASATLPGSLNQSLTVTYTGRNSTVYGPSTTAPTNAGDYTASATYAGSSNYNASSGSKSYQITKGSQTITFAALADKTFGENDFAVSATATSGLAVSFSAAGNCSLPSPATVRITGAGTCTVTASQPGDANYDAAPNVARSFSIAKASQLITFNGIQNRIYGAPDFRLFAQTSSTLVPTFATVGQCVMTTPTGNTVHITGAGSCTITASQAGNVNFNAAPDVSRSFQIAKAGTLTAVSSSANPSAFGQSVTFTAAVTSTTGGAGAPAGTVQFEIDGANVGGPAALDSGGVATLTTSSLSVGAHGVTARYGGGPNFEASAGNLAAGQEVGSFIEFSQSSYSVNEGASLTVTVRRTGDTTQEVSVDYATDDGSTPSVVVPCSTTTGIALDRCDYTKAIGTLRFASGETEKTFVVLGGDDSYAEGPETAVLKLSNPSPGAALVQNSTALFTINDDSPESTGNPSDDEAKFVTQHYRDFLNRDADAAGLAFWKGQITSCGSDSACRDVRRINVSAAFFLSIEFQETGYLVYRAYKTAYGDATSPNVAGTVPVIRIDEFLPDTQRIGQGVVVGVGNWQQTLEANKRDYFAAFISRARFENAYPTTLSPAQFVNNLFLNAGVTPATAERNAAVAEFGTSSNTGDQLARARVLRSVAEHPALAEAEKNRAFVLMEYYGYLRRNPNDAPEPTLNFAGWRFWLAKLEQFNGNFVSAEMVKAFISSDEYRHRFGQ